MNVATAGETALLVAGPLCRPLACGVASATTTSRLWRPGLMECRLPAQWAGGNLPDGARPSGAHAGYRLRCPQMWLATFWNRNGTAFG
jgi:hypothetical protein